MTTELYFIYDTHCPWSYAAAPLVNEVSKKLNQIEIHLWHCAYYEGDSTVKVAQLSEIEQLSNVTFTKAYKESLAQEKDSTLSANLMAWAQAKAPKQALTLLNELQKQHFEQGNELAEQADVDAIIDKLKLSPPAKVYKTEKLSKDAEAAVHDIFSLQDIIGTQAIPALLLAIDDELILLNHNFYLQKPEAIIEAIELEVEKHK